jgi:sec-independent protein translocase protein TatA
MFGLSPGHLILLLVIVVLIFGTKKLRNLGEDLGSAIKGFRKGMQDGSSDAAQQHLKADPVDPATPVSDHPADIKPKVDPTNSTTP